MSGSKRREPRRGGEALRLLITYVPFEHADTDFRHSGSGTNQVDQQWIKEVRNEGPRLVRTLWTFWQNAAQLHIYGSQANTLVDNAGVIQAFGARNLRMAQDYANIVGGISADQVINMKPEEQLLLIEGKHVRCMQVRYYKDELFQPELQKTT